MDQAAIRSRTGSSSQGNRITLVGLDFKIVALSRCQLVPGLYGASLSHYALRLTARGARLRRAQACLFRSEPADEVLDMERQHNTPIESNRRP
jgi:hypothetical protein